MRLLCKSLRRRGLGVLLLADSVDAPAFGGCADVVVACEDLLSEDAVAAVLAPHLERIVKVATVGEGSWPAILGAGLRHGLAFPGLRAQLDARIKPRTRALLAGHLPLAHRVVGRDDGPLAFASAAAPLGLPLVVKPIWGHGGDYVQVVVDAARVPAVVEATFEALARDARLRPFSDGERLWDPQRQLLLEEYAEGRELSVEGFVERGAFVPLMIQEKLRFEPDIVGGRFETATVSPAQLGAAEADAVAVHVQTVMSTLGLDRTFVHVELKWDPPAAHLIEVNPRLGGGSVASMLDYWTGIDVRDAAARLLAGEPVERRWVDRDGFLLGVFVNADHSGVLREIAGVDWARAQPEYCFQTRYRRPGDVIPRRGTLAKRQGWKYVYDVFYHCHDLARADELYVQTKARVRALCDPV